VPTEWMSIAAVPATNSADEEVATGPAAAPSLKRMLCALVKRH
jgi:hypothetical protein